MKALISKINSNSLANELELVAGDKILKINGQTPLDIIDLSFFNSGRGNRTFNRTCGRRT